MEPGRWRILKGCRSGNYGDDCKHLSLLPLSIFSGHRWVSDVLRIIPCQSHKESCGQISNEFRSDSLYRSYLDGSWKWKRAHPSQRLWSYPLHLWGSHIHEALGLTHIRSPSSSWFYRILLIDHISNLYCTWGSTTSCSSDSCSYCLLLGNQSTRDGQTHFP